jgi:PAS domain S-box-containing protein
MVLERKAEFGVHDGGDLIYRRLQGDPLIAVATIFQHSPYVIISKKSSGIRHPADLVGRTLPITQDQGSASILAMFCREGIKVKSVFDQEPVHFVAHPWNFDDFVAGRVVATAAYITELPRFKKLYGYEPIIMKPLDYGIDFYGDTLFSSSEFLKDKPDAAERFRRASLKGWQYAMEHREEIVDVILALPTARAPRPGREELLGEAQAMNDIILPMLVEPGNMNPGRWEKMAQVYRELGMVTSTGNLDGFIYTVDAERQAFRKQLQLLGVVLAGITLLAIISLIWVRMLRSQVLLRTRELADDIVERTRIEDALRLSAERLQLATRAANIGIWDWDIVQNELVWDDSMYQLYGIQKRDFGGAYDAWLRTLHPEDKAYTDGEIQAALRGEHEYAPEFRIVRPDGSIRYIKADSQTLKDGEGKPLRMIGTNFDITERKRMEAELALTIANLKKSEQLFRTLAENSPDVIVRYDRDGRRIYVNPEFERVNRISAQDVQGKTPGELSTELAPKAKYFTEKLMAVMEAGTVAKIDLSWEKDGKPICWYVRAVPEFDADGKVVSALTIWSDITERKMAEDKINELNRNLENRVAERTELLEEANKELEAFSYSVSHDLRTPLRAIDGFSHILLDDYADKLDDEGKRLLNVIRDNTIRMGQLIDDILNFSRTGRLELSFSEIDMEKLARDVAEELQPSVDHSKLQLEIEAIPPSTGDRAMMRQVFVNLLSNAIKFSRHKKPAMIKVGGSIKGGEAIYYVKDNGAGFDMKYAAKLFGVFQRLHSVNEFEGTGIGLAIVKRIITRHGGRVWAEGKVNEGATIYFSIPVSVITRMEAS